MLTLATLKNCCRPVQSIKRVGRGLGSGLGKTCGRGEKGAGSRSGYKRRLTYEGGQFRMFMKTPIRGFSNARFRVVYQPINLNQIDKTYHDGEIVNAESLMERGFFKGRNILIKILGKGELTKKVKIEAHAISDSAKEKLNQAKIEFSVIKPTTKKKD